MSQSFTRCSNQLIIASALVFASPILVARAFTGSQHHHVSRPLR